MVPCPALRAADVVATATADRAAVRLSDPVRVTLAVEGPAPLRVEAPAGVLDPAAVPAWLAHPPGPATVTARPGGRQRWERVVRVDPYQVGDPVRLGFAPGKAFAGPDPEPTPVAWPAVEVRVTTGLRGESPAEARPATGIEELPPAPGPPVGRWEWAAAGGALAAAGGAAYLLHRRRRHPARPPTPDRWAAARLAELEADPAGAGFADQLSEAVRRFVEARTGVPATRLTTAEVLAGLPAEPAAGPGVIPVDRVAAVLTACDAAKFAGRDLTAEDRRELLAAARAVVTPETRR